MIKPINGKLKAPGLHQKLKLTRTESIELSADALRLTSVKALTKLKSDFRDKEE